MKRGLKLVLTTLFAGALTSVAAADVDPRRASIELFSTSSSHPLLLNPTGFQLLSDPNTAIDTIIITTPYREDPLLGELASALRPEIKIVVVVKSKESADYVWQNLTHRNVKRLQQRLRFVLATQSPRLSRWGRDPYIVLNNPETNQFALVGAFAKGSKRFDEWEDRYLRTTLLGNDFDLAGLVNAQIDRVPTWLIEGGAITADDTYAYIGKGTIAISSENETERFSEETVIKSIETVTNKKIIALPAADLHSDRFHIPVGKTTFGERTSLLADPVKALEILASLSEREKEIALKEIQRLGLKWSDANYAETQEGQNFMARLLPKLNSESLENFLDVTQDEIEKVRQSLNAQRRDEAATVLQEKGIAVVRLPVLNRQYLVKVIEGEAPNENERNEVITYPMTLAYTNIIQDSYRGKRTAYIPKYGIKRLDDYVYGVYKSLRAFDRIVQINSVQEAAGDGGPRCRLQVIGPQAN